MAAEMERNGERVYASDEKMGVQALEHAQEKQPGKPERVDPEYIRHGTSGIIAAFNVADDSIACAMVQPTRTEADYLAHIESLVALNPSDKHKIIHDSLNTHMSESLVKFVAKIEGIPDSELGRKGKSGILKSMKTRAEFLSDPSHQIEFVYTPKHCSWLNQIECWFSIIARRLLNRRSSFASVEELEQAIREFIDYYNRCLKKPFQWNYEGKLLKI